VRQIVDMVNATIISRDEDCRLSITAGRKYYYNNIVIREEDIGIKQRQRRQKARAPSLNVLRQNE